MPPLQTAKLSAETKETPVAPMQLYLDSVLAVSKPMSPAANYIILAVLAAGAVLYHLFAQWVWPAVNTLTSTSQISFLAFLLFFNGIYIFWSTLYFILDYFPERFNKYRIQSFRPIDWKHYRVVFKNVVGNVLWQTPVCYMCFQVYLKTSATKDLTLVPSLFELIRDVLVSLACFEIGVYYSHRFLHLPYFYKRIHKYHHELKASVGLASIYGHPAEHVVHNVITKFLGPMLMGSHYLSCIVWLSIVMTLSSYVHSDYCFGALDMSVGHDWHHYAQQENYGVTGLLDYLYKTDREYQQLNKLIEAARKKSSVEGKQVSD